MVLASSVSVNLWFHAFEAEASAESQSCKRQNGRSTDEHAVNQVQIVQGHDLSKLQAADGGGKVGTKSECKNLCHQAIRKSHFYFFCIGLPG